MISTLHALVDYFNVAGLPSHRPPRFSDHLQAVERIAAAITATARRLNPQPRTLRLRLYGGWHDEASDDLTEARQALGAIGRKHYPTPPPLRVFVQPADSLMASPRHNLHHTLRFWRGFGPFRTMIPRDCAFRDSCAVEALHDWRSGRCPHRPLCPAAARDAVFAERQKMVDTAMVADTIHFARHFPRSWVAVVSNDDDVVPGLIAAAGDHQRLLLFTLDRSQPSSYASLLDELSVDYLALDRHAP